MVHAVLQSNAAGVEMKTPSHPQRKGRTLRKSSLQGCALQDKNTWRCKVNPALLCRGSHSRYPQSKKHLQLNAHKEGCCSPTSSHSWLSTPCSLTPST